jgi:hypothetical protein
MGVLMDVLPPWATDMATGVIAILAGLLALYWSQMQRIRGTVRRMVKAAPAEQARLAQLALSLAGKRPALLLLLEQEAHKRHQTELANAALAVLKATGRRSRDVTAIQKRRTPERAPVTHPTEVVLQVSALLDQGMVEAAADRLTDGLVRWPLHSELLELRRTRLPEHRDPPTG